MTATPYRNIMTRESADRAYMEREGWLGRMAASPDITASVIAQCVDNARAINASDPFAARRARTHLRLGLATPEDFVQFEGARRRLDQARAEREGQAV